jgi:lysine decarboxylase
MLDNEQSTTRLRNALVDIFSGIEGTPRPTTAAAQWTHTAEVAVTPSAAFFAPHETVTAAEAVNRVSAELIAPYPPGIPLVMPGEVLTPHTLDALATAASSGARIAYAADSTLATLQVIRQT